MFLQPVVCCFYLLKGLLERCTGAAQVHTHKAGSLLAEHCAIVHSNLGLFEEELHKPLLGHTELACIEEHKVRCLRAYE